MAPSTRASSAQNTPNTRSKGTPSAVETPTDTPTKRAYTCRQCKRPKKGDHPRSGCPYVNDTASEEEDIPTSTEPLTNALGSMKLNSPMPLRTEEDDQAFKRNRRRLSAQPPIVRSESLVSLSTNSSDLVERLATLNDHSDEVNGKVTKVVRWEDTIVATPKKQKSARSPMPGTLIPPTPDSSFGSSLGSFAKQESPGVHLAAISATEYSSEGSTSSVAPPSPSPTPRAQPLTRTMSAVERDLFVSKLTSETAATIYTIPKADIRSIQEQATALKFIACTVMNNDPTDPQALLILGREEEAVQKLRQRIEEENKKAGKGKASSPSKVAALRAAAGGAVIGAVGTFAGLAFS
ncbi:unnamed protein product [Cyclocybe aegerita]|uniref:Uncharacterized protein n=1 Tax=Cyclocybe aegerita TaxID=1973307 RepID=A0A8S0W621_CYCAE|nr:unnamed protein product [Cyclocybe aegerita]